MCVISQVNWFISREKYNNDRDFYINLWRIKYGKKIAKQNDINNLIDYVNGRKILFNLFS